MNQLFQNRISSKTIPPLNSQDLQTTTQGKKVLVLNYAHESLHNTEISQLGYSNVQPPLSPAKSIKKRKHFSFFSQLIGYRDTRVDYDSPFLNITNIDLEPAELLNYKVDSDFFSTSNYNELLQKNKFLLSYVPDYVLIEIPSILYHPYPPGLVTSADITLLTCRANHVWSQADQGALDNFMKLTSNAPLFLLNGVELQVIESVLGDLPKRRSRFRIILKKLVRFQISSRFYP